MLKISYLIAKFLKVTRVANAINLRNFNNPISWFETEASSFSSFFCLFPLSSLFLICTFDYQLIIEVKNIDQSLENDSFL